MTNFDVQIVSDTICPWCYLGQKRLGRAIEIYKKTYPGAQGDTFTISWHPFYLEPDAPKVGVSTYERMNEKFGEARAETMRAQLQKLGKLDGIDYTFRGKRGSTRDSHRVIYLAGQKGPEIQNKVVEEIFKSYFENGGDLTSQNMLTEAGVKGGLDRDEVSSYLEEGKGGDEVDKEVQRAYGKFIHAVPNIVIEGKYQVQGADDPDELAEGFARLKKEKQGLE